MAEDEEVPEAEWLGHAMIGARVEAKSEEEAREKIHDEIREMLSDETLEDNDLDDIVKVAPHARYTQEIPEADNHD